MKKKLTEYINGGKPLDKHVFHAWGDYKMNLKDKDTGEPLTIVGALAKVKYSIVRKAYINNTGKKEETLKAWIIKNFKNKPGESYLNSWFSGNIIANNGTETKDPDF